LGFRISVRFRRPTGFLIGEPIGRKLDRYGREILDDEYHAKDFERVVALPVRTASLSPANVGGGRGGVTGATA
jgi:hypothetical protein